MGNLYEQMAAMNELIVTPGRTVDVNELLHWAVSEWGEPAAVVTDAWKLNELMNAMQGWGIPQSRVVLRRMGWKDGSEDVRAFQRAVQEGRVKAPAR